MYSGNATVVNWLMRFPALAPVAAAVVAVPIVVAPPPAPPTPPPPIVEIVEIVPPQVPRLHMLTPVESLCPPTNKLTKKELGKLTAKERGLLKIKGCIKG